MLEHGAKLGVEAEDRCPFFEPNSKFIMGKGDRVADNLQRDILDGCKTKVDKIGPDGYKISPIFVRLKQTGQARIMSDLPAPQRVEMDRGEAWSPYEDLRGVKGFEML